MKKICITILTLFLFYSSKGQDNYSKSVQGIDWVKIESKADVTLKTHSKNELLIKATDQKKSPDRAKGLKLIGSGATDNTDVGFYVVQDGKDLIVKNLRKWSKGGAEIYLPANQNISVTTNGTGQSNIAIHGFKGEIEANAKLNGGIKIDEVSGPITANSLNGGIDVSFVNVNQSSPITIYSTNGALDIKLPKNTGAELGMSSTNGEIYTDFELKVPEKDGLRSVSNRNIRQKINGGGVKLKLKTTNGNIYLRKS